MKKISYFWCVLLLCLFSTKGFSQDSTRTVSKKYTRIAYIDHSRIRSEYFAFKAVKDSILSVAKSAAETYQQTVRIKDSLYNEEVNSSGSKEIKENITKQKQQLLIDFQENEKSLNQRRVNAMQEYERKIKLAIRDIIITERLTDVKPIPEDKSDFQGIDITDLVIRSLNLTK